MFGMAQGNQRRRHATFCCQFLRRSGKDEEWLAAFLFADVDVPPAHRLADAGAKCFRDRFLARKSRRQMARWKFHRHRIFNFAVGKNAAPKFFAKAIERMLNSTRSTPMPSTLIGRKQRSPNSPLSGPPGHSSLVICHHCEQFLNRVFNSDKHCARHD